MEILKLDKARREIQRASRCLDRHILLRTAPTLSELEHCHKTLDMAGDLVTDAIEDSENAEAAYSYVMTHKEPRT